MDDRYWAGFFGSSAIKYIGFGIKPKWVSETYDARLDYVVGRQVEANTTFSFVIPQFLSH